MNFFCGARCYQCGKEWDKSEFSYLCPSCMGNLELIYEYPKIKQIATREFFHNNKDYSLWRYAPFLPLEKKPAIPLQIGWTPLYSVPHKKNIRLYIKDEGRNPSASLKDRASSIALGHALEKNVPLVTGASTGNAGSSMACLSASVGMPAYIFVPCQAPQAKIAQLMIFGANVLMVKGNYDQAFDLCLKISQELGWYNRNTGYNPYTREGKKTCAMEICEQLQWQVPDWVAVSVGDGNIISGLAKGFSDLQKVGLIDRLPKMVAVQSTLSNSIARSIKHFQEGKPLAIETVQATTIADSISVDFPRDGIAAVKAVLESGGIALEVSDEEILSAIPKTARQWGIFGEPAGVASLAGLQKMLDHNIIKENESIVCVITGNGLKDVSSAIKAAGTPPIIEANITAVKQFLHI
ncbi:MAG: threonine synthase [Candidatus Brocadiae bacterium]|nr:threonine synthase [Candidatus Brocadiia bacterium]